MGTPLYNTDVIPLTSRPTLTVMDDGDYFAILDTNTGKISKILRTDVQKALNISYDNATSGLTATQVQAALDELVVNLGSSDSAISALGGRLDILEGADTVVGSVAKTVKDAVEPIIEDVSDHEIRIGATEKSLLTTKLAVNELERQAQIGNGATLDFSDVGIVPLDARATGRANPTVEGLTATNLVPAMVDSNADGVADGWSHDLTASMSFADGEQTFTAVAQYGYFSRNISIQAGNSYFVSVELTSDVASAKDVQVQLVRLVSPFNQIGAYYTLDNVYQRVVFAGSLTDTATYILRIIDRRASGWTPIKFKLALVVNLTSIYGAGNEPSASDCAKIFSYFDGTKSIQLPARVRSVGKNLLDYSKAIPMISDLYEVGNAHVSVDGDTISASINSIYLGFGFAHVPVYPTSYNINLDSELNVDSIYVCLFDKDLNVIGNSTSISGWTTASGGRYRKGITSSNELDLSGINNVAYITFALINTTNTSTITVSKLQLNLGSTAAPYEPYTDSTLYIADNEEVRSVPAIADEVKVVNGQLVKVGKVGVTRLTLLNNEYESTTNYKRYVTNQFDFLPDRAKIFGFVDSVEIPIVHDLGTITSPITSPMVHSGGGDSQIGLLLPIGTADTRTLARQWIVDHEVNIQHQLATPIITPLLTSGTLKAFQNGTVYFEPYYEGSHQTDASSQITLPYEGKIEAVYGYDEDLVEYLLDSSEYSLTGTTLTITDALENEVFYVEMSRSEPLAPEMSVNVINNAEVAEDSVTGKFYKKTFTVADGIPTFGIEEVV